MKDLKEKVLEIIRDEYPELKKGISLEVGDRLFVEEQECIVVRDWKKPSKGLIIDLSNGNFVTGHMDLPITDKNLKKEFKLNFKCLKFAK